MKKLQQLIDAAFPEKDAKRSPQGPSEAFAERERSFATTAARVEALRQARVEAYQPANAPLLFEVVRHRGSWRIRHRGKHTSPFSDQTAAIMAAVKQAKAKREAGAAVEVRLNRTDGGVIVQSLDEETPEAAVSQNVNPADAL
jgi:inosine-uridine nucleoside N-ribohydrolase